MQAQVGAKKLPERPITSRAEFYYRLQQALGITAGVEPVSICPREYHSDKFICALDCEKAAGGPGGGAAFTGLNTRDGQLLTLEWKGTAGPDPAAPVGPSHVHVVLQYTAIVNLKDGAVEILE